MSEIDFTAARVLALAARDAARRLRDECKRLLDVAVVCDDERFAPDDRRRANCLAEQSQYLVNECNDAVGAWTRASDLKPQPQPPSSDGPLCGEAECRMPQCVAARAAVVGWRWQPRPA